MADAQGADQGLTTIFHDLLRVPRHSPVEENFGGEIGQIRVRGRLGHRDAKCRCAGTQVSQEGGEGGRRQPAEISMALFGEQDTLLGSLQHQMVPDEIRRCAAQFQGPVFQTLEGGS